MSPSEYADTVRYSVVSLAFWKFIAQPPEDAFSEPKTEQMGKHTQTYT